MRQRYLAAVRASVLALGLVWGLSAGLSARAAEPTTAPVSGLVKINEAVKAVEAQSSQVSREAAAGGNQDRRNTMTYIEQVKMFLDKKDYTGARSKAQDATQNMRTADYQIAWNQLLALINKECEAQRLSFPETVKAALENARVKCLQAKTEDQLAGVEDELQSLLEQAQRQEGYNSSTRQLQNAPQTVRTWRDMLAAQEAGNIQQALNYLSNIESNQSRMFTPTEIAKVRTAVQERINADQEKRIAGLAEVVAKAATAEDCQKALDKFSSETRNPGYPNRGGEGGRLSKAALTVQAWISAWQEMNAGRIRHALAILNQPRGGGFDPMSGSQLGWDYGVIPEATWKARKAELSKMITEEGTKILEPELKQYVELINQADTLDAMLDAIKKSPLDNNRNINNEQNRFDNLTVITEINAWTSEVAVLAGIREDLANNRFKNVVISWVGNPSANMNPDMIRYRNNGVIQTGYRWKEKTQTLRQELLLQALTHYSQIPNLKIVGTESPDQMLLRVADEAFKAQDYRKVLRALDAYRTAFNGAGPAPEWLLSDTRGCAAYLAGLNYEEAEVPMAAARSYIAVLAETGSRVPVKAASERLKKLRQKYPEAVDAAATQPAAVSEKPKDVEKINPKE